MKPKHPLIKATRYFFAKYGRIFFRGSSGLILWKRYGFPETKSEHKKPSKNGQTERIRFPFGLKGLIFNMKIMKVVRLFEFGCV